MNIPVKKILGTLAILMLAAPLPAQINWPKDLIKLMQQCDNFYYARKYREALEVSKQVEAWVRRDSGENSVAYAVIADQFMGMVTEKTGDLKAAELWYRKAVNTFRSNGVKTGLNYGEALVNTSNFYNSLGMYQTALPFLEEARPLFANTNSLISTGEGAVSNNLGQCYQGLGQYAEAEGCYLDALDWVRKRMGKQNINYATALSNLGALYFQMGNNKKSLLYNSLALAIFRANKQTARAEYFTGLSNRANIFFETNQVDSAAALYDTLNSMAGKDAPLFNAYLTLLINYGYAMGQKQYFDSAVNLIAKAVILGKQRLGDTSSIYLAALGNLCNIYTMQGKGELADSVLRITPVNIEERYGSNHSLHIQKLINTFNVRVLQNDTANAGLTGQRLNSILLDLLPKNFTGFSENEKRLYIDLVTKTLEATATLVYNMHKRSSALVNTLLRQQLTVKGLLLYQKKLLYSNAQQTKDSIAQNLYHSLRYNEELFAKGVLDKAFSLRYNTDSLQQVVEELEKKLSRQVKLPPPLPGNKIISEICGRLKKDEAAVEFISFLKDVRPQQPKITIYGALILKGGDTNAIFVPLCTANEPGRFFKHGLAGREAQSKMIKALYMYDAKKKSAYQMLWKPLEPYLSGCRTIYFSPTGLMHQMAAHALPVGPAACLSQKYRLRQLSSLQNLLHKPLQQNTLPGPAGISLWGNITYDKKLPPDVISEKKAGTSPFDVLKQTREEITAINRYCAAKGINSSIYQETAATEELFKKDMNGFSGAVHISTHGFFHQNPGDTKNGLYSISPPGNIFQEQANPLFRCGLVLAGANHVWLGNSPLKNEEDGILTGYEISQLDMHKASLVTLSACETALGEIHKYEGVYGLQRAFFVAGADKIIMSLWQVEDRATAALMKALYKYWIGGMPVHKALDAARKDIRKKNPNPYYWAGFVLVE
jgi:CHAT domain-containing protein